MYRRADSVVQTLLKPLEVRGIMELVTQEMNNMLGIAANLTNTCYQMYATTRSGDADDVFVWFTQLHAGYLRQLCCTSSTVVPVPVPM